MSRYRPLKTVIIALAALLLTGQATGENRHHQQAHVHGEARLQIAIEGKTIDLMLSSPAANLLGFEHQAISDDQQRVLAEARAWLETTALVQTPDSDCTLVTGSIYHQLDRSEVHDHDHRKDSHSDLEVTQMLHCDSAAPKTLVTPLMKRFPDVEHLSVEWLNRDGQGHIELQAGDDEIRLQR